MGVRRLQVLNHKRLDDLEIEIREHLVLVGANDVGKSSLLRVLDLILGASTAQLYANVSVEDFRGRDQPFVVEVDLKDFTPADKMLFPDEIAVDPANNDSKLTIRLSAKIDASDPIRKIGSESGGER